MSDSPNPSGVPGADSSQTVDVFSGDLADDDLLWVARCSVTEFARMLATPTAWVASLAGLPTWNPGIPAPSLTDDFVVLAQRTSATPPDGWVMVQGIAGTNALTVVASEVSAVLAAAAEVGQVPDVLAAFWAAVATDPSTGRRKALRATVLPSLSRWFGHFEVRDAVSTPAEIATRTAAFLLATLYDPVGYASMLNGLTQEISLGGTGVPPAKIAIAPPAVPSTSTAYANVVAASWPSGGDRADDPAPDPFICTIVDGSYDPGGTGTSDGGVIKRYGVEDGPSKGN